jgi:hypothetical protein
MAGQWRFAAFYQRAARILREMLAQGSLREVYIVNNDNLLTNHILATCGYHGGPRITVIAEGLMNYQDIQLRNRAGWRETCKKAVSRALGLQRKPVIGHLSGSFDPAVSRVVTFEACGIFAPSEKVLAMPFKAIEPKARARSDTILYVETALWQWMRPSDWQPLARAFAGWIRSRNKPRLLVKQHPNYAACPFLRSLLPAFEIVYPRQSIEEIASGIDATEVVGTCCTGLVTLKYLRPDISIFDFGADVYVPKAYHGDRAAVDLMQRVGVTLVQTTNPDTV